MSKAKTYLVKAAKGLKIPVPRDLIVNSPIKFVTDSNVVELRASSFVRGRIRKGDLIDTQAKKKPAKKSEPATTTSTGAKG